ncbi:MAG: murein L,D-transpeptidase [Rhodobacteraceae bacterium]|nr:murein L,D-transpeptidase [Paracoccaceae bacterium]
MRRRLWLAVSVALIAALSLAIGARSHLLPTQVAENLGLRADISEIRARQRPLLTQALEEKGLSFGAPVHIRIFKEEAELELWVADGDSYALFRAYPICSFSGGLGPKLQEGDRQAPEGFYNVDRSALNPGSRYHLSFNLGFPNAFDRANGRTGSFLMVHGKCVSIGCYAMTDPAIEEIYVLVEAALDAGHPAVPVHAFPFRMTEARLAQAEGHAWFGFWQSLAPAYNTFEDTRQLPTILVQNAQYQLQ